MRCQVCGASESADNPMYQLACARPLCLEKHVDDDGEVIDCSVLGPFEAHFNAQVCERCGGSAAVEAAVAKHRETCSYRSAA